MSSRKKSGGKKRKEKKMQAVPEVQLILEDKCSPLRLVKIPWHISEQK